jgi:hypothetical protein
MTLHITYVSPQYVLQVSDRLVTRQRPGGAVRFDPEANKTIIYVARDAFVSIGYSGRAYLDNRPTDQWIAEKLNGEEVGSRARVTGGGIPRRIKTGPTGPWLDIGSAIRVLREELVAARDLRGAQRQDFPRLIVAGWQRWKRRVRPVAYVIADDGAGPLYRRLTATPRYDWLRGRFYLNFTPLNSRLRTIRGELAKQLEGSSTTDEAEQRMAQALRLAADQFPEIGKDYLAVLLPPPSEGRIRTRYVAFDAPAQQVHQLHEDAPPYAGPVGFAPWIITPHYEEGPAVLVNSQAWVIGGPLGDIVLEMEGLPAPPGANPQLAIGSQVRPSWPPLHQR